jgi:hypothetical protein
MSIVASNKPVTLDTAGFDFINKALENHLVKILDAEKARIADAKVTLEIYLPFAVSTETLLQVALEELIQRSEANIAKSEKLFRDTTSWLRHQEFPPRIRSVDVLAEMRGETEDYYNK